MPYPARGMLPFDIFYFDGRVAVDVRLPARAAKNMRYAASKRHYRYLIPVDGKWVSVSKEVAMAR